MSRKLLSLILAVLLVMPAVVSCSDISSTYVALEIFFDSNGSPYIEYCDEPALFY